MKKQRESQYQESRLVYEFGRPYFLPFFIMFIIAVFGEIQVAIATFDWPAIWSSSFLFSHFGLFLSLSILTMGGVVWAVRHGLSEGQRRLALATLTIAVILMVFAWPTTAEPLTPVFRIPLETTQQFGSEVVNFVRDGTLQLQ